MDNKHNTKTSRNSYPIIMFQRGLLHEPYFIAINNWGQVIVSSNKKIIATYVVGELEVLIWFIRTWILKTEYYYDRYLMDLVWTRIKDNDDIISYAKVVSVSTSCNRCYIFASFLCFMTCLHHVLWTVSLWFTYIYSIDILLYSYVLPLAIHHSLLLKSLSKCNLSSKLRS